MKNDSQARYERKIHKVLMEQNFIIEKKEQKIIRDQVIKKRRYFFMVGKRKEGSKIVDRFIKIPENNNKKLLKPFQRQIEVSKYIKSKGVINTRAVIDYNYNPKKGIPFAIMETFPLGHSKIGFIQNNNGVEFLGKREAENVINQIKNFHSIKVKFLPKELQKILKVNLVDYKKLKMEIFRILNKKVKPFRLKGKQELFYKVLENNLGIEDIKNKVNNLLFNLEPIINSKKNFGTYIAHGDMAPNNLYVFDSGDVELLDLEWTGVFNNKAISMIVDFGNFRARSWKNEKFKNFLDSALIKYYISIGQEEIGKAILKLSILRSHLLLSRYFENYEMDKQKDLTQTTRRNSTEKDIIKVFNI